MIIYKINDLSTYEICSNKPNSDWTGKAEFVIDESNPENQDLINKIKDFAPYFDYVLDENGNLINVIKTGEKPVYEEPFNPVTELQEENKVLQAKITALTESNQFLEDCIVELAEIVYA